MSVEPAGSAAICVTWRDPEFLYELRWYGTDDYVIPLWWIGIVDQGTNQLDKTEVLHPTKRVPGEVFRWLVPIVGQDVAGKLISLAAEATMQRTAASSR